MGLRLGLGCTTTGGVLAIEDPNSPPTANLQILKMRQKVVVWLTVVCLMIVGMVAVGGITRLTQSGLSIVEWKPVTGVVPPIGDVAWQAEFEKYQQYPQFQKQFMGQMTLEQFKGIFFWEWFHRLLGRTVGLVYVVPMVYFWRKQVFDADTKKRMLIALALGGAQGVMGWVMVKSGLVNMPHVSHYRLAAHLILAFVTMGWLEWTSIRLFDQELGEHSIRYDRAMRLAVISFAGLLGVQIVWGAFTAGLRAGFGYPTWPTMNGSWVPEPFWVGEPSMLAILEHPPSVQFVHRWLGALVGVAALVLGTWGWMRTENRMIRAAMSGLVSVALVQFGLGVLTVLTSVSVAVGVTHQVFGCMMFAMVVYVLAIGFSRPVGTSN